MYSNPLHSPPKMDMSTISSSHTGRVTYWSCVAGYGFVRSSQVAGRMTIYRDSLIGVMVEEVSLARRMVRFRLKIPQQM
jgi:hypothetical protein